LNPARRIKAATQESGIAACIKLKHQNAILLRHPFPLCIQTLDANHSH
jgi:hypothetical protein